MMTPPVPTMLEAAASIPSPCPSEEGHAGQAGSGHTLKDKATGNGNPISPLFRQSLAEYRSKMPRREQVEDARLARLGEAADYPDGFFLMLHQVLCLNTWDCAKLSMNVSISPKTRNGMLLASALLDPANTVRYEFFQHFSSFPMDFVTLLKTETNFQLMISHLPTCLNAISDSLHNLRVTLERRRTPPLVRELQGLLRVSSAVFQRAIFFTSIGWIWPGCTPALRSEAEVIFSEDQALAAYSNPPNKISPTVADQSILQRYNLAANGLFEESRSLSLLYPRANPGNPNPARQSGRDHFTQQQRQRASGPPNWNHRRSLSNARVDSGGVQPSNVQAVGSAPLRAPSVPSPQQGQQPSSTSTNQQGAHSIVQQHARHSDGAQGNFIEHPNHNLAQAPNGHRPASFSGAPRFVYQPNGTLGISGQHATTRRPTVPQSNGLNIDTRNLLPSSPAGSNQTMRTSLIPRAGVKAPQVAPPNPGVYAAHQAHLRSPKIKCIDICRLDDDRIDPAGVWFQETSFFAFFPVTLDCSGAVPIASVKFNIPSNIYSRIANDETSNDMVGSVVRNVQKDSLSFRLRCVQGQASQDLTEWVIKETSYPEGALFTVNGQECGLRLKHHYGKHLPVNLTRQLKEGENMIVVYLNIIKPGESHSFAIEVISLLSRIDILANAHANLISRDKIVDNIARAINPTANESTNGDDELQCLDTHVYINLIDPLSGAWIWKTPARGKKCRHREAFDLETFIDSRRTSTAPLDEPSSPDKWFCPICGEDARPQVLIVDGFLMQVRNELENKGELDSVKAIEVDAQGEWRVKERKRDQTRPSIENEANMDGAGDGKSTRATKQIETIELD